MTDTRTAEEIEAALQKARAEARIAEIEADRKKQELDEWKAAKPLREREASASVRKLEQDNAAARRAQVKELVPDLTKVTPGSTSVPESSTMFDALLAGQALESAASALATKVWEQPLLATERSVLVTTDLDLTARDGQRHGLTTRLDRLRALVEEHLRPSRGLLPGPDLAVAAAALLPGLLSLISPRHTVSTSTTTVDDTVAMMAVAGALAASAGTRVLLDKARFVGEGPGPVRAAWDALDEACQELRLWCEAERASAEPDPERLAQGDALLEVCESALTSMTAAPEDGGLSPLAAAELQDVLHTDEFGAVLVVKGGAASTTQFVNDRRFRADKFSVMSTASIAYVLVDHRDEGRVAMAGLVHGARTFNGAIGSAPDLPTVSA